MYSPKTPGTTEKVAQTSVCADSAILKSAQTEVCATYSEELIT
jgi:hypothetical protein